MSANEKNPQQEPLTEETVENEEIIRELLESGEIEEEPEEAPQAPESPETKAQREERLRKEEKRSNMLYAAIAIVFVLVAAVTLVWKTGYIQRNASAAVVNGQEYNAAEVQYYYNNICQNFINNNYTYLSYMGLDTTKSMREQTCTMDDRGITWFDYFLEQGLQQMAHIHTIADKAEQNGYAWNDEMQAAFDETMALLNANVESYNLAEGANLSTDDYIHELCGDLVTQKVYEEQLKVALQAQYYAESYAASLEYSEADLEAVYAANPLSYDKVDYEQLRVKITAPSTTDAEGNTVAPTDAELAAAKAEAEKVANELYAKVQAGEELADLAIEEVAAYTNNVASGYYQTDALNWVFDDSREAGDTDMFYSETNNCYYVVKFHDRYRQDYNTVNVRHILLQPEAGEKTEADEGFAEEQAQLKADAEAKANDLYAQWKAGEATEDSFAQLANEHSTDGGSNTNGGLYTQIYQGQMVPTFNDWCFDEARRTGDTGVVETDYGYHIMYFVGKDMPYWQIQANSAKMNEDCSVWYEAAVEGSSFEPKSGVKYIG